MMGNIYLTYKQGGKSTASLSKPRQNRKPRKRRVKYNHPKKLSNSAKLLDAIEAKGDFGMTFGQAQKMLYELAHPGKTYDRKRDRGFWTTGLYGTMHRYGLLSFFCDRKGSRYVRNSVPHEGQPWAVMDRAKGFKHASRASNWRVTSNPYNLNWSSAPQQMMAYANYTIGTLP